MDILTEFYFATNLCFDGFLRSALPYLYLRFLTSLQQ